ncbi:MAG: ABC transporter ATP-binding protein [Alphaproteobacteria bacterium]|nr:ABC transporter ATP-binding protein [Alphaproteobacteria bacterium]MCW5742887.1 ABC transporter ATP-binding protein [Alphaproteobacteria bacterium]
MLTVQNLNAGYGRSQVLFDVSLSAPARGGIAVLGRNGAGKSTLLRTLFGELPPSSGMIIFSDAPVNALPAEERVRRGLGYVPQEYAIFSKLSVRENLLLGAVRQAKRVVIDDALDFFPKLGQRLDQTAGTLSGGERKMLAIGRAILGRPRLLMLDEPTEGVWVGVIEEIADRLRLLSREMTVILVEQHIELALEVAGYAYVMDRGRIALEGTATAVKSDPALITHLAP